jgi:glyoxylase-like metal-dependent hydrolase (beta-lactamase superfamily II)
MSIQKDNMKIKTFVFNPFQLNTYVLYDESKSCVIVDPGCYDEDEENELKAFITENGLTPAYNILTHCHVDHVLGLNYAERSFGIITYAHPEGYQFITKAHQYAAAFGFDTETINMPQVSLSEGEILKFGVSELKVLYTPGHVDGSVCLVAEADKFVVSGDVLFYESIGRTDLPTGNLDILVNNIRTKLFTLPEDFVVYPGHGHETNIGYEKRNNPFL